ncbi:MAG: hypothetical protein ABR503_12365, partial [Chitinophagaceae bacterium]
MPLNKSKKNEAPVETEAVVQLNVHMRKNESIMFIRSISYYYIKGIYSYQTEKTHRMALANDI